MSSRATLLSFALLASFPSAAQQPAPVAQPPAAAQEKIAADAPRSTPGGVSFTAPHDWTLSKRDNMALLVSPEGDASLAIVDVEAADAKAAVEKAWASYRPESKRPIRLVTPQPAREGWEERHAFNYETSPNERLVVFASAQRAGSRWSVTIAEGAQSTFERRASQIGLVVASIRPAGYQRESFAGKKAHPLSPERIEMLKAFVEEGMKKLDVPGVGLAFIDGGKVVWEGGLGVKEMGKAQKVDAHTAFMAASNTKGLTTLMLARLVDRKKLRWDQPVVEVFPQFKLGDAQTTRSVLVKHLICACTGMPRQDFEWLFEFKESSPEKAMKLLGTMQPTTKFGALFQYSNLMAAAAGYTGGYIVAPKMALGPAYDLAMRREVFDPLGMKETTFDFKRAMSGNYALPHGKDADYRLRVVPMDVNYSVGPVRPTGGVWTTAHDLGKYVVMELAGGKLPDGQRYVSEENLRARHAPTVKVGEDIDYGMGLFSDRRWGVQVMRHGGDMIGYHSDMMWFPEHGVGAVILTNSDPGVSLRGPLLRRMAEVLFDGKPEAQAQVDAAARNGQAARAKFRERLVIPPDPAEAAKLAGRYESKELGSLVVSRKGDTVLFDLGEWKSEMASRRNDDGTTSFFTISPDIIGFDFVVAEREGKRALVTRDAQHEYVFMER
jgi:CubicO group peptidase (beta-lactamase class C family)